MVDDDKCQRLTDAGDRRNGAKGPVELNDSHWATPACNEQIPIADSNDHGLKGVESEAAINGQGNEPRIPTVGQAVAVWVKIMSLGERIRWGYIQSCMMDIPKSMKAMRPPAY
jgi:hypothetical protein